MPSDPNDPQTQARAAARIFKAQIREEQATEREREEAARVIAIDEKTARLKTLRLEREAEAAVAKKAKKSK